MPGFSGLLPTARTSEQTTANNGRPTCTAAACVSHRGTPRCGALVDAILLVVAVIEVHGESGHVLFRSFRCIVFSNSSSVTFR